MKLKEGTYDIKEIEEAVLKVFATEQHLIQTYLDTEGELIGFSATFDYPEMQKKKREEFLWDLGVSEETVLFFEKSTTEERAKIQSLALINYHQKELERLQINLKDN